MPTSTVPASAAVGSSAQHLAVPGRVSLQVDVSPGRVLLVLLLIDCALVGLSLASLLGVGYWGGDPFGVLTKFNVDSEGNIPTWYSSLSLTVSAALLWLLSRQPGSRNRTQWLVLSAGMAYLSLDEAASLHELLVTPLRTRFHLTGVFHYAWVVVAIPVVAALALYFVPLLREVTTRTAILFISSGTLFVSGGLGLELVEGFYATARGQDLVFQLITHLEELMEMLGISVFIYAILCQLQHLQETR